MNTPLSLLLTALLLNCIMLGSSAQAPIFEVNYDKNCPSVGFQMLKVSPNGHQYQWDFGNGGTSTEPTPGTVYYTQPGTYAISLTLQPKTGQDLLYKVEVIDAAGWGEFPFLDEHPDFYIQMARQSGVGGAVIYTSPVLNNTKPVAPVPVFFLLEEELYLMKVIDWDLIGNHDLMGTVVVDGKLQEQELTDGKLRVKCYAKKAESQYQHQVFVTVVAPEIVVQGDSLYAVAGGLETENTARFQWFLDGELLPVGSTPAIRVDQPGSYAVKLTVPLRCDDLSSEVQWPAITQSSEPEALAVRQIFPNPAPPRSKVQCLFLCAKNTEATLEISDLSGRLVSRQQLHLLSGDNQVAVQAPAGKGAWLVRLHLPEGPAGSFTLITQ